MVGYTKLALLLIGLLASAVLVRDGHPARAAFPGASGKIAFATERDARPEVYIMNADGSGQNRLTYSEHESEAESAWSPDGTRIAFRVNTYGAQKTEIYVMNADGGARINLTNSPSDEWHPDWQPLVGGPVGGIAELPDVSSSSEAAYAAWAGLGVGAALALTAAAWYARRKRLR